MLLSPFGASLRRLGSFLGASRTYKFESVLVCICFLLSGLVPSYLFVSWRLSSQVWGIQMGSCFGWCFCLWGLLGRIVCVQVWKCVCVLLFCSPAWCPYTCLLVGGFRHKSGESKWEFFEWRFLPRGVDWGATAIDPRGLPRAINASRERFDAIAVPSLVAIWCSGGGPKSCKNSCLNGPTSVAVREPMLIGPGWCRVP